MTTGDPREQCGRAQTEQAQTSLQAFAAEAYRSFSVSPTVSACHHACVNRAPGHARSYWGYRRIFDNGGLDLAGAQRQAAAIVSSGDRRAALAEVKAPTLVLHGDDDRMVRVKGGKATAAAIPGAKLVTYPGMGHDLPANSGPPFSRKSPRSPDRSTRWNPSTEIGDIPRSATIDPDLACLRGSGAFRAP